jgi:hypothetical protein
MLHATSASSSLGKTASGIGDAPASAGAPASLDVPPSLVGLPEAPGVSPPCPAELAPPALTSELGRLSLLHALEIPKKSASAAGAAQKSRRLRAIFSVARRYHAARSAAGRRLGGVGQLAERQSVSLAT